MDRVLIPAQGQRGDTVFVSKSHIERLIAERKIQQFRRSTGWVRSEGWKDPRRNDRGDYQGPERRFCRKADWSLFMLPIAQQLRKSHSVEMILGYGERAREITRKLKSVANTNLSVLLQGKTGTG